MSVYLIQANLTRGELTPRLHARIDIDHYRMGLRVARNWLVVRQGGIVRRTGSLFQGRKRDMNTKGRLIPFQFSESQSYIYEFGAGYIRFWTENGRIEGAGVAISAVTKAVNPVVTVVGHPFVVGDYVHLDGVTGMVQLNGLEGRVVATTVDTVTLDEPDTAAFSTYSSGGFAYKVVEVATTWTESEVADLQVTSAGDVLYIASSHRPAKLTRTSATTWTLADIDIKDGPYLDENTTSTTLSLASRGASVPVMTNNTTPSGTVSNSDGDADAYRVFDLNPNTENNVIAAVGWWQYLFPGGTTKVVDAYWLQNVDNSPDDIPISWTVFGYDGSAWIPIDQRSGESGWRANEKRFYECVNRVAYQGYRLDFTGGGGADASSSRIAQIQFNEAGDGQTAFNLTASSTTGINGGLGFVSTDVGRSVRIIGADGKQRWLRIVGVTSSTVATVRQYGHAHPGTSIVITRWALSAFSVYTGFPRAVGFKGDRLVWGGTTYEPRKVWGSKVSGYEDHGRNDPIQADDGLPVQMTGGSLDRVQWVKEGGDLLVGTTGAVRTIGAADSNSAFSATNVDSKEESAIGAGPLPPVKVEKTLIFADRFQQRLHEVSYDINANGYQTPEVTILSDHIFRQRVLSLTYQRNPRNIVYATLATGVLGTMTYERTQQVVGCTPLELGGSTFDGGFGEVEDCAVIPGSEGDQVWLIVRRNIQGKTTRYIEVFAPPPFDLEEDQDEFFVEDAVYADSAITYRGAAANVVYGFNHLIGETVGILADGVDLGDVVVASDGSITLPNSITASIITAGLRFESYAETLRTPTHGNADGAGLGRAQRVNNVMVDVLQTAGLYAGTLESQGPLSDRTLDDAPEDPTTLQTGMFNIFEDDSWRNGGVGVLKSSAMYPAYIRSITLGVDGEP